MFILDAGLVMAESDSLILLKLDGTLTVQDANFVFVHICNVMCQSPQPLSCFSFKNRHFCPNCYHSSILLNSNFSTSLKRPAKAIAGSESF